MKISEAKNHWGFQWSSPSLLLRSFSNRLSRPRDESTKKKNRPLRGIPTMSDDWRRGIPTIHWYLQEKLRGLIRLPRRRGTELSVIVARTNDTVKIGRQRTIGDNLLLWPRLESQQTPLCRLRTRDRECAVEKEPREFRHLSPLSTRTNEWRRTRGEGGRYFTYIRTCSSIQSLETFEETCVYSRIRLVRMDVNREWIQATLAPTWFIEIQMISPRLDDDRDNDNEEEEEKEEDDDPPGPAWVRRNRTMYASTMWIRYVVVWLVADEIDRDTPWKRTCFTYMLIAQQRYSL